MRQRPNLEYGRCIKVDSNEALKEAFYRTFTDDPVNWIKCGVVLVILVVGYVIAIPLYGKVRYRIGWERKRFEKRLNADLWIRFLEVYRRHRVRFVWVKGHADNPMNNRCDQLAVAAATAVQNMVKTDEN